MPVGSAGRDHAAQPSNQTRDWNKMQIHVQRALAAAIFLAIGSSAAFARHPCHNDAERFCHNVIPDRRLVQHCLERNMHHLRPACQAEFRK